MGRVTNSAPSCWGRKEGCCDHSQSKRWKNHACRSYSSFGRVVRGSLFQKLAFENKDSCPYPQVLESIGRKLVAKCRGLPLAVKALRSLLYSKTDRREWEQILESEIWGLQDHEILPSLLSSYQNLPLHLKQCFAYCSIFSKDHEFDKDTLILLWMAGLLQFSKGNDRMGRVGEQYFDELLSKSFFQKSALKESCFVIHDLIHDLAQYIYLKYFVLDLKMIRCKKSLRTLVTH